MWGTAAALTHVSPCPHSRAINLSQVRRFFGSLDAVQAAFWPPAGPALPPAAAGVTESATGGEAEARALALDVDAVMDAYASLTALRSE
jgi:hypothetical protein